MISHEFSYHLPSTMQEAVSLFKYLESKGKRPIYYGGGTELTSLGRLNLIPTDAVIDIKGIPECRMMRTCQEFLTLGAALPLTHIEKANEFPLLTQVSKEVADLTARNQITLGGNVCGQIFYREAVLPFLLTDSEVFIASPSGGKYFSIQERFDQRLQLQRGEFLVLFRTKKEETSFPFLAMKRRSQWETGYPLVTIAAIKKDSYLKVSFSGVCPFPFRSGELEEALNQRELSLDERVRQAVGHLPRPILNDVEGSADFRIFIVQNLLRKTIAALEGDEYAAF